MVLLYRQPLPPWQAPLLDNRSQPGIALFRSVEDIGMRLGIIVLAVLFVAGIAWKVANARPVPAVGSPAPDFSLPSQDSPEVSLKDFRGKWVVLYFYPKDMTTGCTIEAHNFQRDQPEYAKKDAVVLGVSVDSVESHKQFCTKEGLNFKLLSDTTHQVAKAYGSVMNFGVTEVAARNTFIIDPQGKIVRTYTSVNPNKHSEEVLAALGELAKGPTASK
jgi:peroxiredoxin Q/BCP